MELRVGVTLGASRLWLEPGRSWWHRHTSAVYGSMETGPINTCRYVFTRITQYVWKLSSRLNKISKTMPGNEPETCWWLDQWGDSKFTFTTTKIKYIFQMANRYKPKYQLFRIHHNEHKVKARILVYACKS